VTRRWAVVPAAGHGSRFGSAVPKQYSTILGLPVIEWTLQALLAEPCLDGIVVAVAAGDRLWTQLEVSRNPRIVTCVGGERRELSVANALVALAGRAADTDWVLVHDAARPCLRHDDLQALFEALGDDDAVGGLLAVPVSDTLKRAGDTDHVAETVTRESLWRALTPQMFRYGLLQRALALCIERGRGVTDEASAIECLGLRPRLVRGHADNIKVTDPEDSALAEAILRARATHREQQGVRMRVGTGYDVHAFGPGDHVTLGGVRISHGRGVVAHSDGDVVLHALCDALLGAMALGDIGQHFPDSDPRWKGADSRHFVRHCASLLRERGWCCVSVDLTVVAQEPRIGPHRAQMLRNIAEDLGLGTDRINVKATTTEGLGALGRREGLACQAVVLLAPEDGRHA
jgi:2-C-methyl-D-erythritol 4-phosphate cytidylyltransferase/2-C-methyl-D-erythritol 2,4-cyclodiphosphate synthase